MENSYKISEIYVCKYATAENVKLISLTKCLIKLKDKKLGLFLKVNDKEYVHILTGKTLKVCKTPTTGQTWIRSVSPLSSFVTDQDKSFNKSQINMLELKLNSKYKINSKSSSEKNM